MTKPKLIALLSVATMVLLAGAAQSADTFEVRLVSQTSTTITLGWTPQPGYGYLFSSAGVLRSRTNDPARSSVKFSKVDPPSYDVDVITKGSNGHYPVAPPPPPPSTGTVVQTIVSGSTIPNIVNWRAVYDADGNGTEDDPGSIQFLVDGTQILSEVNAPFGDSFAEGTITVANGLHTFMVRAVSDAGVLLATSSVTATVNSLTAPACSDTVDNDSDGKVDYPADPGCSQPSDTDETDLPPPPQTGFPDASNTGVPSGTTLTAYTGPSNITTAGTVIDGKTLGCIDINAANVVIRNSRISCGGSYYAIQIQSNSASVRVEDSEIDCKSTNANGAGRMNITLVRVEISLCENGLSVAHDVTVQDSYIHDLFMGNEAHADGMQFEQAAGYVNIIHNTIFGIGSNGAFGTSSLIADYPGHHDWLIERNLFGGGAYTVYCVAGKGTNWVIRNNAFTTRFSSKIGAFGPATQCADETQSGNYILETGQPLTLG